MAKAKKRDSAYWLARLRSEHPPLARKVAHGDITVRKACIHAGLISPPSRLVALKREWNGASVAERKEFVLWARGVRPSSSPASLLGGDGYLSGATIKRIRRVMVATGQKSGDVMYEMGLKRLDPRLGFALQREWKPGNEFLAKLTRWLATH